MALIKDRAAPVFDSEQVHKGDLIRAKHKTWDDSAWFIIAVDDLDSIETIYLTFRFRFAAEEDSE